MPLTQLSTLVLPAPLGPMSANSSPGSTASEMSSSTVRPPNRSVRRSIASSAIPSPVAAILLDVAVARSLSGLASQVELLNVGMIAQPLGGAVEHDLAILHDVAVIGNLQRDGGTLLNHENGDGELATNISEPRQQILDYRRSKAERELIDQQELRRADNRTRQREHLPFAAGKKPTDAIAQGIELGKQPEHQRLAP